jgi:hypothetical protein
MIHYYILLYCCYWSASLSIFDPDHYAYYLRTSLQQINSPHHIDPFSFFDGYTLKRYLGLTVHCVSQPTITS